MDTSFSFHAITLFWVVLCLYYLFSYPDLLELHYGERVKKSQIAKERARETGLSVREAEWRIDAELFLNKYPRWELGAPHWSVILHKMFLHAAEWGQKEVERLICWGCRGSASEPDLGVGQSAMELVGYWTSCKEIWDIYHSVYLLRRSPGLLPCWAQWRRKVICNILSSLTSWLHRQGEGLGPKYEWLPRLSRRGSYEEALKVANQRVLETVEVLRSNIQRLSQGWGIYYEPAPEVKAEAGDIAEAGAIAEVVAGVTVRVFLEVTLGIDDQGPLVGPNPEGGWLSKSLRLSQTLKGRKRTTHQSPPFQMLRYG